MNDDISSNDVLNDDINFVRSSNKRRKTNEMAEANKQSVMLQPEFELNIYGYKNKIENNNNNNNNNNNSNDIKMDDITMDDNKLEKESRSDTPYEHLVHPYLRNKNKNKNRNNHHSLDELLSDEDRDKSPELMLSKLNLNGFKMRNKENESVNEWRDSIEKQLNFARNNNNNVCHNNNNNNKSSEIEELCHRINSTNGLGRDVLLAKLRKSLPNNVFQQICHRMNINVAFRS